tara:strand:+ start:421 stop:699 length:279 start_codon:yes stop_codon:yes gene_type:complete
MPKKRKKRKKHKIYKEGKLYISPDGGETVYEQNRDGTRGPLVSQSELASEIELAENEIELHGVYAIQLRKKYPALKKAWDKYKLIWNIVHND